MHSQAAELLLDPQSPLAQHVDGFTPRPQQQHMARAVERAITHCEVLVAEAGTGTGKTYAYLIPALLSGKKIIISTGTRNLQDQLFHKDLPLVRKALGIAASITLLKGRGNYICRHRLGLMEANTHFGLNKANPDVSLDHVQPVDLIKISDWVHHTQTGDIAEVVGVDENAPIWPKVTSTVDNCLGQDCPQFNDCFLVKARRKAMEADIVIINHYLFCADMVIKETGFGEVLPSAQAVILDEAHQLPEVAGHFFGLSLSSHQLNELVRDVRVEQLRDAPDFPALAQSALSLEKAAADLRLALGRESRRAPWTQIREQPAVIDAVENLTQAMQQLNICLKEAAVRGKGLESCQARCDILLFRLQQLTQTDTEEHVQWFETKNKNFSLNATPLEVSNTFRARMAQQQSGWIFTSATLAVGADFTHFIQRMGLNEPTTLYLESPFDYAHNAIIYHPKGLPEPTSPHYIQSVLEATLPVLRASRGRAFILFTSHQALREAAEWLQGKLEYPLLIQGGLPKAALLERFRELGNAVLLGTASFWEGVDVRGDTLSCVVITKLPFASPSDPVLQARITILRRRGGNPFIEHQLPQAVIALKQGVGRLIRDIHDRGVLMLCDPRLLSKSYGRTFLDSLPPMTRTRSLAQVEHFFEQATASESNIAPVDNRHAHTGA
jgi:ATP-dependent DNA helicase DinG